MSGESAGERWSPVQRVESVLLSIISLLDDAETSSPANVDAGVQLRMDRAGYKRRVREDVEKSKVDIPPGFVMPTHESTMPPAPEKPLDDREFWVDSDADDDDDDEADFGDDDDEEEGGEDGFGGSDTDEDVLGADEDDDDQEDDDDEDFEDEDHDEAQKQKHELKDDNAAAITAVAGEKKKKAVK